MTRRYVVPDPTAPGAHCCYIAVTELDAMGSAAVLEKVSCDQPAVWDLYVGPRYEDNTQSCAAHVAALIGDAALEHIAPIYPGPVPVDTLDVLFDGPPSHESGRFVEVESFYGREPRADNPRAIQGTSAGEWIQDGDLWRLRIHVPSGWLVG